MVLQVDVGKCQLLDFMMQIFFSPWGDVQGEGVAKTSIGFVIRVRGGIEGRSGPPSSSPHAKAWGEDKTPPLSVGGG